MANLRVIHLDLDTGQLILKTAAVGGSPLYVLKTGDTMSGFLTLSADPIGPLHAVTKQYVDNKVRTYSHVQAVAATVWAIAHNGATVSFVAQAYVDNELVEPNAIRIIDSNNIEIEFNVAVVGQANLVLWG